MKTNRPVLFVLLFALAGVAFYIISSYNDSKRFRDSQSWINHTHEVISLLDHTWNLVRSEESAVRGYAITSDGAFLHNITGDNDRIKKNIQSLTILFQDNHGHRQSLKKLEEIINTKLEFQKQIIDAKRFSVDSSLKLIASLKEKIMMDSISEHLTEMKTKEEKLLQERIDNNRKVATQSLQFTIGGSVIVMLFIIGLLLQLNKDIKLRRQAQDEAQKTALKYREFVENAGVVTYSADAKGDFTFISNQVIGLTGYTADELLGKNFSTLISPDWINAVANKYIAQFTDNVRETTLVFPIIHKSGQKRWVEQDAVLITKEDGAIEFQCVVKDVTEKVLVEERLKKVEEEKQEYQYKIQSILDNAPLLIYVKDLHGRYVLVNRLFKETFNISCDEAVIGKTVYDIESKENGDKYSEADRKVIETEKSVELEDTIYLKDGPRHLLTIKFPLFDKNNKVFGVSGFMKDITDMVRFREDLIAARQKAESAEMLQEQFLANMSHEIRTPMNGIVGMGNMLMQTELLPQQKEYVQIIQRSSDNLLVLINDILDLSKIKAGKIDIERIPFHLNDIIQQLNASFNLKAKEKGILFSVLLHPSVPEYVKGDPHRINQILNNLLSNAMKFTEKGYVTLEIAVHELYGRFATLCLQVSDSGIGIEKDHLGYIFENFAQASSDTTRKFGGTGLGLAITKQLIEMQHGTISVSSKTGVGTTFSVLLPFEISKESEVLQNNKPTSQLVIKSEDFRGKRILVAEDNEINQFVLQSSLQQYNLDVTIVSNGREAVDWLQNNPPADLILMDLRMPEMDGFQATEFIRKELKSSIPIVILTASALGNERQKSFEIGADAYVTKPFAPAELQDCLKRFLLKSEHSEPAANTEEPKTDNDIFDLSALLMLKSNESIKQLYNMFEATVPKSLEELKQKAISEDWNAVFEQAHKLKGSLGIIQVKGILGKIQAIESNARNRESLNEILPMINESIQTYDKVIPMIRIEVEKKTA